MRIALFVSVLGHELCNHVFQPTYLHSFAGLSGLGSVLKTLAEAQPDLESHLRSVLLKASTSITVENEPVDRACIKAVVTAVKDVVQMVIPEAKRTRFEAELHDFCNTVCERWRFIQTLDDRIVPNLGTDRFSKRKYNWALFSCNIPTPSPPAGPKQRANGTASAPGPQKRSASPASRSQASSTADLAAGIAVWPAFYNLTTVDEETLAEGYILPVSLTRAAEEEQNAVPTPTSPSARSNFHKEQREMERSLNPKKRRSSIATVNGQAGEAKERSSFLSKSSGSGAKGV
ncbi:hypothetical protein NEMBOFW57_004569 [Staphylotrichum longicolle]|uniref:Uncharacterized protein n=1 Tax=Staphylotrichum longicolle TaxID=669026 RepID=A0AAD4F7D1_9PEZI|nr:hypothetical protein NEMBOFW57_004569 [Staphylotrichum longicolle]